MAGFDPFSTASRSQHDPFAAVDKIGGAVEFDPFAAIGKQPKQKDWFEKANDFSKVVSQAPLQGINAVLGAPERFVQGAVGSQGDLGTRLGYGAYGMFHPNDEAFNRQTLDRIEQPVVGKTSGWGQIGADTAAQTLLDPLTYLPFIGEGKALLRGGEALGKGITAALPKAFHENWVKPTVQFFATQPEIAQALGGDQAAVRVYRGVYSSSRAAVAQDAKIDAMLLRKYADPLRAGEVPSAISNRLSRYMPELEQTNQSIHMGENMYDAIAERLAAARGKIFEDTVNDRLLEEMKAGTITGEQKEAMQGYRETPFIKSSRGPLTHLADLYRSALFVNPLPHMFNVARLAYYAGGLRTVGRGLSHFFNGVPEEAQQALNKFVGRPEYLSGAPTGGEALLNKIPGVEKLRNYGQDKLSQFDNAMRASYMQELEDVKNMRGQRGYDVGQDIQHAFGGYGESQATRLAQSLGAPFAPWRLGVVPTALGRAALRNPERLERYARFFPTMNQDLGTKVEFGGPEEDFGKLTDVPAGTKAYLSSPSTIGPAFGYLSAQNRPKSGKDLALELARNYVPGGSLIEEAFGMSPYKESDNKLLNFILSVFGGYAK